MVAPLSPAFLSRLHRPDQRWLTAQGTEQQVIASTVLLTAGQRAEAVYLVLEGKVDVLAGATDQRVATLGPGAVVGEMGFVQGAAASATVVARENTLLLRVPHAVLAARTAESPRFAAAFSRAVAAVIVDRLQKSTARLEGQLAQQARAAQPVAPEAHPLQALVGQAKALLLETDKCALRNQGTVPAERAAHVREQFAALVAALDAHLGDKSALDAPARAALGQWVQGELLPYLQASRMFERMYAKPRGYAGDFFTIACLYDDEATGTGRLGPLLDRCFLDQPAARAVRNRRGLLAGEILSQVQANPHRETRVTSLASGPAAELFDVFSQLDDPTRLAATCIDIDREALAFVQQRRDEQGLGAQMRLEQGNLVYLASGRAQLDLPPQDLVYSIGLIDYFSDRFVVGLLDYVHGLLAPGGQVILGNFHPDNPTRALMDHVLDWKLIHRTEEDLNRLFSASAFGAPCARIEAEAEGINLFAVGRKA